MAGLDPIPFFFLLTLAAAAFLIASRFAGGRRGRGRGRRRRSGRTVRFWSLGTLFSFAAGVGIGGFFTSAAGLRAPIVATVATATGLALAGLEYGLLRALVGRESSSALRAADFVGCLATVEISILEGGVGRIRCRRGATTETLAARSTAGPLAEGSLARVTSVAGSIAIVEPADAQDIDGYPSWKGSHL
jgi:membrane protein implicated in regulation of membrane protease activity